MRTIYTVKPEYLIRDAEQSLRSWIILGQIDKYGAERGSVQASVAIVVHGARASRFIPIVAV